ncbi:hypothetical protein Tco_0569382 [Tanacetum coccineum]
MSVMLSTEDCLTLHDERFWEHFLEAGTKQDIYMTSGYWPLDFLILTISSISNVSSSMSFSRFFFSVTLIASSSSKSSSTKGDVSEGGRSSHELSR